MPIDAESRYVTGRLCLGAAAGTQSPSHGAVLHSNELGSYCSCRVRAEAQSKFDTWDRFSTQLEVASDAPPGLGRISTRKKSRERRYRVKSRPYSRLRRRPGEGDWPAGNYTVRRNRALRNRPLATGGRVNRRARLCNSGAGNAMFRKSRQAEQYRAAIVATGRSSWSPTNRS